MRACNGCRKRKIKCDAATTNTWPCSACTRLKLVCVPPSIGQEGEFGTNQRPETNPTGTVNTSGAPESSMSSFHMAHSFGEGNQSALGHVPQYNEMGMFPQYMPPTSQQPGLYDVRPQMPVPQHSYPQSHLYAPQPSELENVESEAYADNDQSTAENLSEVLGELKIDETGIGNALTDRRGKARGTLLM